MPGTGRKPNFIRIQREYLSVSVMEIEAQWNIAKRQQMAEDERRASEPMTIGMLILLAESDFMA